MDAGTVEILFELNARFYQENSASFESSRHNAWPGWERCLSHLDLGNDQVRLLDVACGNLRFERYLARTVPEIRFAITACDSCDALAIGGAPATMYRHVDIGAALLASDTGFLAGGGPFDVATCFGFMHHVPTFELRQKLLAAITESLAPDGLAFITFWRFADDAELLARAQASDERAHERLGIPPLERGDYLLGWNGDESAIRYCHSFADGEIDELADSNPGLLVVDRFDSDGRTGRMNTYLVMKRARLTT